MNLYKTLADLQADYPEGDEAVRNAWPEYCNAANLTTLVITPFVDPCSTQKLRHIRRSSLRLERRNDGSEFILFLRDKSTRLGDRGYLATGNRDQSCLRDCIKGGHRLDGPLQAVSRKL